MRTEASSLETVLSKSRGTTNDGSGTGRSAIALNWNGRPRAPGSLSVNDRIAPSPPGSACASSEERIQPFAVSFRTISAQATAPPSLALVKPR